MISDRLSATFSALAAPTRRAILARLLSGEVSVTELAEPFEMSLPAVSKHLKVLERAGLISRGTTRNGGLADCRQLHLRMSPTGSSITGASSSGASITWTTICSS
jgi:DNA-binding transcriptional ArsR family regulator